MLDNGILSEDELSCIQSLFQGAGTAERDQELRSALSQSSALSPALQQLFSQAKLSLSAELGHYQLLFPATLDTCELGQIKPTLGVPEIREQGGTSRSWRLKEVSGIQVCDITGRLLPLRLTDISCSGMAFHLPQDEVAAFGQMEQLQLRLPDSDESLLMNIRVVRRQDDQIAVNIGAEADVLTRLNQYLYQRHKKLHRDLYRAEMEHQLEATD